MSRVMYWVGLLLLGSICFGGLPTAHAGLWVSSLGDLKAVGLGGITVDATAAHGFFSGNNLGNREPLLTYLNSGTSTGLTASVGGSSIEITADGLFSDSAGSSGASNLLLGSPIARTSPWELLGTLGEADSPFSGPGPGGLESGTLTLTSAVNGNVAIALKAGNQYAVYAFSNLSAVESFTFNNLPHGLGHASLYLSAASDVSAGASDSSAQVAAVVPEPSSLAIFGLGGIGLGLMSFRRRQKPQSTVCS